MFQNILRTSSAGSATLEIQVEWAKSNPSCKLELARFLGGDAPDGKTNKHLATTDRHRGGTHQTERLTNIWLPQTVTEGGTHRTERLTNIDMVGGWARQTQTGGRTGRKD